MGGLVLCCLGDVGGDVKIQMYKYYKQKQKKWNMKTWITLRRIAGLPVSPNNTVISSQSSSKPSLEESPMKLGSR